MYSFLLLRYSCLLSAGILHALLCLKVYLDVSMERDVLRVHLLLHHLVLSLFMYLELFISVATFCFVFIVCVCVCVFMYVYIYIYINQCITHECPA